MGLTEHGKATYNTYWAPLGDCSFLTATTIFRITQFLLNFIGSYWKAIIWNNKEITVENKPVYYKHYVNARVICIQDLNSTDSYNQLSKKICKTNILEWAGLRRSIPLSLRRHDRYPSINAPTFVVGDNIFDVTKGKWKDYYTLLIREKAKPPNIIQKLQSNFHFNSDHLKQIFKLPHFIVVKSCVKASPIQYKVINPTL